MSDVRMSAQAGTMHLETQLGEGLVQQLPVAVLAAERSADGHTRGVGAAGQPRPARAAAHNAANSSSVRENSTR